MTPASQKQSSSKNTPRNKKIISLEDISDVKFKSNSSESAKNHIISSADPEKLADSPTSCENSNEVNNNDDSHQSSDDGSYEAAEGGSSGGEEDSNDDDSHVSSGSSSDMSIPVPADTTNKVVEEESKQPATKKKRPPNFSAEEDVILARCFVSASLNPIVGSEKKQEVFWSDVRDSFMLLYMSEVEVQDPAVLSGRTWKSLEQRFKRKTQPDVMKYISIQRNNKIVSGQDVESWNESLKILFKQIKQNE